MYSKFFIYSVIICTIPLILMDIAFIYSMLTGGYEGNLKATILAVIVFHILLYLLSHKQVKLLIQAFKRNGVNDTLRMYKNDDIRMYNFNCITDTIVEVITTCNTYTILTVHLL